MQSVVKPAIAQLVEHLTVDCCRNQMVPGSIPGGRILISLGWAFCDSIQYWIKCSTHRNRCAHTLESYALVRVLLALLTGEASFLIVSMLSLRDVF